MSDTRIDAERFIPLLREALDRVPQSYYRHELWRHPEWNDVLEVLGNQNEGKRLREYLDRYGERVFCYELYHQIKNLMREQYAEFEEQIGVEEAVIFQAEVKKNQINDIIEYFPEVREPLDKAYIPDFLLHSPGNYRHQEIIIEVKSNPRVSKVEIKEDLLKIHQFINKYGYRIGIFLTINLEPESILGWLRQEEVNHWLAQNLPSRERILFICKYSQGSGYHEWNLINF